MSQFFLKLYNAVWQEIWGAEQTCKKVLRLHADYMINVCFWAVGHDWWHDLRLSFIYGTKELASSSWQWPLGFSTKYNYWVEALMLAYWLSFRRLPWATWQWPWFMLSRLIFLAFVIMWNLKWQGSWSDWFHLCSPFASSCLFTSNPSIAWLKRMARQ